MWNFKYNWLFVILLEFLMNFHDGIDMYACDNVFFDVGGCQGDIRVDLSIMRCGGGGKYPGCPIFSYIYIYI